MASPNKIKNMGYDYKPFEMKASGVKYNNSPIEKNYGSPAHRGFADFTGGVGSKEMDGGVGTAFDYASPNKFFGGLAKGALGLGKRLLGGGGGGPAGGLAMAGAGIKAKMAEALAKAKANEQAEGEEGMMADAGEEGAEMAVPPHGNEAHTGGGAKQKMFTGLMGNRISGGLGGMKGGFGSLFAGI